MSDTTRRTVLAGAVGAGAAVALAACGGGSGGSEPAATTGAPPTGPGVASPTSAPAGGPALTQTGDIPVGGGKVFDDQKIVVTQPTAGQFKAFTAICTHMGCTVGSVANGTINCPCHGSQFAIADGAVVNGPAKKPLPAKKITVSGGSITAA